MAYSPTYTSDDLTNISVDGIGTIGVKAIAFIGLFIVVGVVVLLKKNWDKLSRGMR